MGYNQRGAVSYRGLLLASAVGVSLSLSAVSAHAQSDAPEAAVGLETIVVTGTRLATAGFQAPTPVTVLGADALQRRAPANMAEAVNELPSMRMSAGPINIPRQVIGSGQQSPDLRGLGTSRTLVLVDGRRWVGSQLSGTADMSTLPVSLVERVEVVTGGASAAYGSDAVAGVVNFILNDRLVGVRGGANYGVSQYGDTIEHNVNLAAGFPFAGGRGHFIIGGDIVRAKGAGSFYDRNIYRDEPGLVAGGPGRPAGMPAQNWIESGVELIYPPGGIITTGPLRGTAFREDGSIFQMQLNNVFGQNMIGSTQNYGRNSVLHMRIYQPFYRKNAMARVNFDVTPNVTLFGEFNYAYNDNIGGNGDTFVSPGLTILRDNPFIPAAVLTQMNALNLQTITVGRYNNDFTPYDVNSVWNLRRGVIGARGRILDNWQWEASYVKGQNIQDFSITFPERVSLNAATYVVRGANGNPVCGDPATNPNLAAADRPHVITPCVPFNVFGQTNSQAAIDYVSKPATARNRIRIDVGAFTLNGSPFGLPAGEVSVAVGAEFRKESVNALSDPRSQVGAFVTGNQATYSGDRSVKEGFAEIGVPLLRDLPWALELGFNGSARRTDYTTSGAVTTWKVGGTYRPTDFLRFRVTQSRDIRAPGLNELFLTRSTGGVSNIFNPFTGQVGRLSSISGGNPGLKPEIADSFTAGLVFQPTGAFRGFQVALDYYDIKINEVIASIGTDETINRCFAGEKTICNSIVFDNTQFGIFSVAGTPQNLNQLRATGYDFELSYRVPMDMLPVELPGQIEIRNLTTLVGRLTTTANNIPTNRAGYSIGGVPKVSGNLAVTYTTSRLNVGIQARYFRSLRWNPAAIGPDEASYNPAATSSVSKNLFPGMVYLNGNVGYDVISQGTRRLQLFLTVNNLLNKRPSLLGAAAFNQDGTQVYDIIGRTFRLGFRFNL
jgi:iron complex outermembrane receptor protein